MRKMATETCQQRVLANMNKLQNDFEVWDEPMYHTDDSWIYIILCHLKLRMPLAVGRIYNPDNSHEKLLM